MTKWQQGVNEYVKELLQDLEDEGLEATEKNLLNGATDWKHYSYGGNSCIYDWEIAERLVTLSVIKRKTRKDGSINQMANSYENWLDLQARALHQACRIILNGKTI
jgi:hypothetical protein